MDNKNNTIYTAHIKPSISAAATLLIISFLFSCGGGGSDDPAMSEPTSEPTPIEPAALILSPQNAIAVNQYTNDIHHTITLLQENLLAAISSSGIVLPGLSKSISGERAVNSGSIATLNVVNLDAPISVEGACSGIATGNIAVEDSGDFYGTVIFDNFNNCDLTISGTVEYTGTIDYSLNVTSMTTTLTNVQIEKINTVFVASGTTSLEGRTADVDKRLISSVFNLDLNNSDQQGVSKLEDVKLGFSEVDFMLTGVAELIESISGRVYLNGMHYIDVQTKANSYRRPTEIHPYGGAITYIGDNSALNINFRDTTPLQYKSLLDIDLDGVVDYSSQCIWEQLCPLILRDKFGNTAALTPTPETTDDIANTGQGGSPDGPGNNWIFGSSANFAGKFSIAGNTMMTSAYIWLALSIYEDFEFSLTVYRDNLGKPGEVLFTKNLIATMPLEVEPNRSYGDSGWYGWNEINLELTAGSYWVGFQPNGNASPHALSVGPAQSPLANYASLNPINDPDWVEANYLRIGIVVEGVLTP